MSMLTLAACLAAGFLAGRFLRLPKKAGRVTGLAITAILFPLVFLLGWKLGSDGELIRQFGTIGLRSLALGFGCTAGSVLFAGGYAAVRARMRRRKS
jgi:hypothetical protein